MTLAQFGRIVNRTLTVEKITRGRMTYWRVYYPNTLVTDQPRAAVAITVIGSGPNQERAKLDLAQKLRGKYLRALDGRGGYHEFEVPRSLTV